MRTSKLFHVLVLAGGTLGALGCSSGSDPEPQKPGQAPSAVGAKDKDASADDSDPSKEPAPPADTGSGSHFW